MCIPIPQPALPCRVYTPPGPPPSHFLLSCLWFSLLSTFLAVREMTPSLLSTLSKPSATKPNTQSFVFYSNLYKSKKYWGAHSPQKALHSSTITELSRGKNDLAPLRTACPNQECRNKSLIGFIHPWQSNRVVETGVS